MTNEGNYRWKRTEKHKEICRKAGLASRDSPNSTCFKKGHKQVAWNKGLKGFHHTSETIDKFKQRNGEKNPAWKGGITPINIRLRNSDTFLEWRKNVFARDNYTCQFCYSVIGGKFNAHHIQKFSDFPMKRFDVENGITLCSSCHGQTQNNEENWEFVCNYILRQNKQLKEMI